jgi:hypothetical protein
MSDRRAADFVFGAEGAKMRRRTNACRRIRTSLVRPSEPVELEYLVCRICDTPCYGFEMDRGRLLEATCLMCGNDDILLFRMTEDEDV